MFDDEYGNPSEREVNAGMQKLSTQNALGLNCDIAYRYIQLKLGPSRTKVQERLALLGKSEVWQRWVTTCQRLSRELKHKPTTEEVAEIFISTSAGLCELEDRV